MNKEDYDVLSDIDTKSELEPPPTIAMNLQDELEKNLKNNRETFYDKIVNIIKERSKKGERKFFILLRKEDSYYYMSRLKRDGFIVKKASYFVQIFHRCCEDRDFIATIIRW
jgi:hypothetical protein